MPQLPSPVDKLTSPPSAPEPACAEIDTPPMPLPTEMSTLPLLPVAELPLVRDTDPDEPTEESPENIFTPPAEADR